MSNRQSIHPGETWRVHLDPTPTPPPPTTAERVAASAYRYRARDHSTAATVMIVFGFAMFVAAAFTALFALAKRPRMYGQFGLVPGPVSGANFVPAIVLVGVGVVLITWGLIARAGRPS